jgi:hypothetical protein
VRTNKRKTNENERKADIPSGDILLFEICLLHRLIRRMPPQCPSSADGICSQVLNRGNGCAKVFHTDSGDAAFVDLLAAANERLPARILGYVLMPNHFRLERLAHAAGDLTRWMQWLMTSHVRRHHRHYNSSGHGTLQGISNRTGRTPADGPPLRRTESAPRRPRRTCRGLDLVESRLAGHFKAARDARPVARRLPAQLGPPRKRVTNRGWIPSVAMKQTKQKTPTDSRESVGVHSVLETASQPGSDDRC